MRKRLAGDKGRKQSSTRAVWVKVWRLW